MNQRMRNRSRNAAMFLGQLVERRDGIGVTQNHGDLPALRAQGRLTLRAGLRLGHELSLRVLRVVTTHGIRAAVGHVARRPTGERLAVNSHIERAIRFFGDRDRRANRERFGEFLAEHGRLRSGPIPPMSESYAVTSDVSTTFDIAPQQDSA